MIAIHNQNRKVDKINFKDLYSKTAIKSSTYLAFDYP